MEKICNNIHFNSFAYLWYIWQPHWVTTLWHVEENDVRVAIFNKKVTKYAKA